MSFIFIGNVWLHLKHLFLPFFTCHISLKLRIHIAAEEARNSNRDDMKYIRSLLLLLHGNVCEILGYIMTTMNNNKGGYI